MELKTKVHQVKVKDDAYLNPVELSEYDLEELEKLTINEVWYYYLTAQYEGMGQMIFKVGAMYGTHDLGHCSCYGPLDDLELRGLVKDPEDLLRCCTDERIKELQPLIDAIKESS